MSSLHLANLLEPWLLLRLVAGLVTTALFARAARTSIRVLRHFDASRATEGQLALERHVELAWALVRVAAVGQVALLLFSVLAADRMSTSIRGAMCAYGVFHATPWGFASLGATAVMAVAAGVLAQIYAFDADVRGFDLVRPLAIATTILAPLAAVDLGLAAAAALDLDLSVVASCCSVRLDAVAAGAAGPRDWGATARAAATIGALVSIGASVLLATLGARRPRAGVVAAAGVACLVAAPFALAAAALEVAPHAFELPQHVCPFCLLRPNVLGIGYPLFGAILFAVTSGLGAGCVALLARSEASRSALPRFATSRLRREAIAWSAALLIGALPVVRYAIVSGGASLFPTSALDGPAVRVSRTAAR